jgi:coenzyme F420-reducing hydrogenase gamma subunit
MRKPRLAVYKFASCDGCQLSLLDCEDELLAIAGEIEIANFPEASSAVIGGPYDLTLVEGSVTTPHDRERIQEVRRQSRFLVTIGACATSGGIQALRNFRDFKKFARLVYARPDYIDTLETSTAIADHVNVDFELRGCPIDKGQLIEVITSFLNGKRPNVPDHSVCVDCKKAGIVCLTVSRGVACLGPVTHTGCGVLCPSFDRGCYGCFGPKETPNTGALAEHFNELGLKEAELLRLFRTYNAAAPAFLEESKRHE